jgi:heme exporter protein C
MRMVFYPAVVGWIGMGTWISTLLVRTKLLNEKIDDIEDEQIR